MGVWASVGAVLSGAQRLLLNQTGPGGRKGGMLEWDLRVGQEAERVRMREDDRVAIGRPVQRLRLRRGAGAGRSDVEERWDVLGRATAVSPERPCGGPGAPARRVLGACCVRFGQRAETRGATDRRTDAGTMLGDRSRCPRTTCNCEKAARRSSHEPSCELRLDSCVHDSRCDVDRRLGP